MNNLGLIRSFNTFAGRIAPGLNARVADRLLWRPRRLPARDWERRAAAQAERVTFAFGLSALRWGGPGPVVLMLHGWEGRPTQFAAFVEPLLAAGRQVIALDGPAHGRSPGSEADPMRFADAALEAAAELPPLEAVIGHSMGGAALALALSRGLRAERAVVIGAPASLSGVIDRNSRFLRLPDAARSHLMAITERRIGLPPAALDIREFGSGLRQPALVIHDREDEAVPYADGEAIHAHWPGSQLLSTQGMGHWQALRDEGVVAAVRDFVVSGRA